MIEIIKILFIAGLGIIAYILGWMNAIKACEENVLCNRQALQNIGADFDAYILNEVSVLNQIKFLLEEDLNRVQKDQLIELINKRINNIEEVYNQKQAFFKETESIEDVSNYEE